jgi:hypothetical protein
MCSCQDGGILDESSTHLAIEVEWAAVVTASAYVCGCVERDATTKHDGRDDGLVNLSTRLVVALVGIAVLAHAVSEGLRLADVPRDMVNRVTKRSRYTAPVAGKAGANGRPSSHSRMLNRSTQMKRSHRLCASRASGSKSAGRSSLIAHGVEHVRRRSLLSVALSGTEPEDAA